MFKLIAHTGEWTELYVSDRASTAVRGYMPPTSTFVGEDGKVVVSEIAILDLGKDERPRVVVLVVDGIDALASVSIQTYLRVRLADEFEKLIVEPGFDAKSDRVRSNLSCLQTTRRADSPAVFRYQLTLRQRAGSRSRFWTPTVAALCVCSHRHLFLGSRRRRSHRGGDRSSLGREGETNDRGPQCERCITRHERIDRLNGTVQESRGPARYGEKYIADTNERGDRSYKVTSDR